LETKNSVSSLTDIEEMAIYRPTDEEFKNPIDYIEKLYHDQKAYKHGCIKIIPPKSFKPKMAFDTERDMPLPTRYQVL